MIQAAIQILINDNTFKTAIGTDSDGTYKVYPVVAKQGQQPPYCVIAETSLTPQSGCSDESGFDLIIYAEGNGSLSAYKQAYDLSVHARNALTAHTGLETESNITCSFQLVTRRDGYDRESNLIAKISTYNAYVDTTS